MKYILAIGIEFQQYKKQVPVQVLIDDILIDDYLLELPIGPKIIQEHYPSGYRGFMPGQDRKKSYYYYEREVPSKIKIYEVESDQISKHLRIKIQCNDNNYQNGFMTQNGMVKISCVFLTPFNLYRSDDLWAEIKHRSGKKERGYNEDLAKVQIAYPCATYFYKNNKDIIDCYTWIGGDLELLFPIKTKFGLKMLDNPNRKHSYGHYGVDGRFSTIRKAINSANTHLLQGDVLKMNVGYKGPTKMDCNGKAWAKSNWKNEDIGSDI